MSIAAFAMRHLPGLVKAALRVPSIHRYVVRRKVNDYANATSSRPRPFSLIADYTSWQSLTDKEFTGRHLPADLSNRVMPDIKTVSELWRRKDGKEVKSEDTSMLFSFFAQWFTDSFLRTNIWDTRKNISNHEIDFCQVYGSTTEATNILRSQENGKLRYQIIDGEVFPPYLFDPKKTTHDKWVFANAKFKKLHSMQRLKFIFPAGKENEERLRHMFVTGLEHGNSHIGYTLMNIIALREHNRICDELSAAYPKWDDERLFQTARMIGTTGWLKVVLQDYIGHIASYPLEFKPEPGFAEKQEWYRQNWISIEFDLLYRWHSMVPEKLNVGGRKLDHHSYRSNPQLIMDIGVETLINDASSQHAGRIGLGNTPEFFCDEMPAGSGRPSIQERTVKMARDAKLKPYNDYRVAFGLEPVKSFEELTGERKLAAELENIYGHIDDLEWFVGIFAEKHDEKMMMGELMITMVAYDAFTHALTNPLFSKNIYGPETFSEKGMEIIESTNSLQDIVSRNVKPNNKVLASFEAVSEVPGSHGIPIISKIIDTIDFMGVSGWTKFFEKKSEKYRSSVFKTNFIEPVIVILDPEGFEPFINWDGRLRKEHRFGFVSPPKTLTGGIRPTVFQNDKVHDDYKAIIQEITAAQQDRFGPLFDKLFDQYSKNWAMLGDVKMNDEIENFCIEFAFEWMFETKVNNVEARLIYDNIFAHHFKSVTQFLPWSKYSKSKPAYAKLTNLLRTSPGFLKHAKIAEATGDIDREELCHQLMFVTGMNVYLGFQNLAKSAFGELSQNKEFIADWKTCQGQGSLQRKKISYFIKETLRLHPPVFFLYGRASQNFVLNSSTGNYQIHKYDQLVGVVPFAQNQFAGIHNPKEFDPTRFEREHVDLVWSHGHNDKKVKATDHACPAKDFGEFFGMKFVQSLLQTCEWELKQKPEWNMKRYSLNVAAPMGDLELASFNILAKPEIKDGAKEFISKLKQLSEPS